MAIPNSNLPFNRQNTQKLDVRGRPSKFAQSPLRDWRFEQSEGIRPAEVYAPYKYLPVQLLDVNTQDYVVIPKGRVVAALSTEDSSPASGIQYPANSGQISIGYPAAEYGSDKINVSIDDSFFGYEEWACGLLVPANGGVSYSGFYTAADVANGNLTAGGAYAAASGAFNLPANAPVGVVFHDWYQDIRGRNLNYQVHDYVGHVLCDWYIEVPYVKTHGQGGDYNEVHPRLQNLDYANLNKYYAVNSSFTYLEIGSGETLRNGLFVTSDLIGNYKPQTSTLIDNSGDITTLSVYNLPKTNQTVGKILAIDNRMPKGGLEDVLTYPKSGMPGSQTGGITKNLFDFAYQCIKIGTGTAPTTEAIYRAIRAGQFGLARIQLLIA